MRKEEAINSFHFLKGNYSVRFVSLEPYWGQIHI